jgi:mono/diheme cytochrome c family protein
MQARTFVLAALAASTVLTAGVASAQDLARGAYIVNNVGLCHDCHSPRNPDGSYIAGRELTGAPNLMKVTVPMPWADVVPPIRGGRDGWSQAQFAAFLQTGKRPDGTEPRPPMPPYRLNAADAQSVAAYLHSLK